MWRERSAPVMEYATPTARRTMLADVLRGLAKRPKQLPSRYLYDERGAELFEQICETNEYYLTRTELSILRRALPEIAPLVGPRALILEPGSGASLKTRRLLEALDRPAAYVPIDLSREQLMASAVALIGDFPHVEIAPVYADFLRDFVLPPIPRRVDRRLAFFPGSTIGNLGTPDAVKLLRSLGSHVGDDGLILIGVDLVKDWAILEAAYDDAEGVSAEFALNILARLNRELDADFNLDNFTYRSFYNEKLARIEMYVVSLCRQDLHLGGTRIELAEDEPIRTELSYKYSLESFALLARQAGLRVQRTWTDPRNYFSVQLLSP